MNIVQFCLKQFWHANDIATKRFGLVLLNFCLYSRS